MLFLPQLHHRYWIQYNALFWHYSREMCKSDLEAMYSYCCCNSVIQKAIMRCVAVQKRASCICHPLSVTASIHYIHIDEKVIVKCYRIDSENAICFLI